MKPLFNPISLEEYIDLHLESNPGTTREEIATALQDALKSYEQGLACHCGNPIGVIGSAIVGHSSCFTCITGEAMPDGDYEIDEACA